MQNLLRSDLRRGSGGTPLTLGRTLAAASLLGLLSVLPAVRAADADSGEGRLRETLRSTLLQLRDTQAQLATLQAAQAADADEKKTLADQLALLRRHEAEDRAASSRSLEQLKARSAEQAAAIAQLRASLEEWRAASVRNEAAARNAASERDRANITAAALQRQIDDLKARNLALYELGQEILTRYKNFGLGDQFAAREPFIGRARVRLENLIQDFGDKLAAQRADR